MTTSTLKNQKAPLWLLLLFFVSFGSVAQTEYLNTTVNYTNTNAASWISTYGGTAKWMMGTNTLGTGSSVNITWNNTGNFTFVCKYTGVTPWSSFGVTDYTIQPYYVTVVSAPPTPNATFTSSATCSSVTVSQTNPLSSGEKYEWWWQTSPTGTSTMFGSASNITINSSGNVYLRSRLKIAPYTWSDNLQNLGYFSLGAVAAPIQLTTSVNTCGAKMITFDTPPYGIAYYWQGTDPNGTLTAVPVNGVFTIGASGNYYFRALCIASQLWSQATKVSSIIDPVDITLTTYEPVNSLVQATNSITLSPGFTVTAGSTFNARILITTECNDLVNWTEQIAYDQNGNPIGRTKAYQDGFGNNVQNQSIDYINNKVWASQPLFDNLNNPSASTMSAPILANDFIYKNNFVQNQTGQRYSASDFDLPDGSGAGEINNPKAVGNAPGTLGWYYSSANNLEPKTPATAFPYSRSYTPPGPNPTTSKSAGVGENYKMGSGHESKGDRYTFGSAVLSHYAALRPFFTTSTSPLTGYIQVSTDANQRKAASFTDADGKTLASAMITTGTSPSNFQYDNWSYSFYNEIGQMVASVAPNGVNIGSNSIPQFVTYYKYDHLGRLIETTSPDEGMSQFVYSTDGKIRFSQNQEQRNANPKRFSYTNYDYLGRLIESGEYQVSGSNPFVFEPHTTTTPSANSVLNIIDNVGFTGTTGVRDARCKETNFIQYDTPASDYPTDDQHPAQTYTIGQVTKSKNNNTTTWYSYDEFGQLTTMRQALPFGQLQTVQWTNRLNVTVNGNSLTNSGGVYWEDRAFSTNSIPANTDGYLEFKAGSAASDFVMGLSASDGATYYTINYGILVQSGNLYVVENNNGGSPKSTYTLSDALRVERMGNTIFYKKNDIIFYTSTIPSNTALFADCNFNTSGSTITSISMGYSNFRGLSSVQWTNFVNVTQNGATLTKTGGNGNAWDAGAFSIESIPANTDGYLEFTAGETNSHKMMGLSPADKDAGYTSIYYAIYPEAGGYLQIYEKGTLMGTFFTYVTGDVFRIERKGASIIYRKNGVVFYTSAYTYTGTLYADCSFYSPSGTINNLGINLSSTPPSFTAQPLTWTNFVNVSESANGIAKTSGNGNDWDAGAFSIEFIPANTDGSIEFMAGEENTYKMMGLSTADSNASYETINFALYPDGNGGLAIYENGTYMGYFGQYTRFDIFSIERKGSTIYYKKNGSIVYTSTISSTGVLFADCSFYNLNASFKATAFDLPTSIKTIDYTYDYFGNVTKVAYQQGQPDAFYHHYEYDKANRLTNAYTSLDGTTKTLQAKYSYYLHGPLKRVELGNNIQGIDYVYNIDGSLKLINHPDPGADPGGDGLSNSFKRDVFGMALDYTANDYVGANYNPGNLTVPSATDLYGGPVKAVRWHSQTDSHVPRAYAFGYDSKYQLATSTFGNVTGSGSYNFTPSGVNAYQENIGGYDKNGNIQSILRKNKAGIKSAEATYNYIAGTNKLDNAMAWDGPWISYQYNSIGQMIQQTEGSNTMKVSYTAYGLTKEIRDASNNLKVAFAYDDRGNRVKKTSYTAAGAIQNITYYVSDAAGNTLAIYEQDVANNGPVVLAEVPIYAAGRVGVYKPPFNSMLYEVSDHLGNVRGVVGKPMDVTVTGTYESANWPAEQQQFVRTESARRINATLFDHTKTVGASYSQRLNGSANEKYGIARPIAVLPGDVINAEVYAKYVDPVSNNWSTALATLMTQIAAGNASVVVDGAGYANPSTFPYVGLNGTSSSTGTGPKAYLNWLVFDKNYAFNTSLSGYMRLSAAPKEAGTNVPHERLYSPSITITEPGYVYIYISNEELTPIEVYFDDFKVTQNMSDIVAGADYYPFGLPIPERELTREPYRYGYQGQYSEKDKETGFNFFDLRMYDARIGRWVVPDPYGQYASGYVGMGNNPVTGVDPSGGLTFPFLDLNFLTQLEAIIATGGNSLIMDMVVVTATSTAKSPGFWSRALSTVSTNFDRTLTIGAGIGDAWFSNFSLGLIPETDPNTQAYSNDYANGQKAGRVISIVAGAAEATLGFLTTTGGGAASLTGGGAIVGGPAIAGGITMMGHGGATVIYGLKNLNKVHHVNSSGASASGSSGGSGLKKFSNNWKPDVPIKDQLKGKGQLRGLIDRFKVNGYSIEELINMTPKQLEEFLKGMPNSDKVFQQINKALRADGGHY